jgi:uncharacterized protein with HEPN domain
MSLLRDVSYVQDILAASNLIAEFIGSMTEDEFENDAKTQSAVIRQLEIIGEASKMVSQEFKTQHAVVPWRKMTDMRNILIHMYNEVDLSLVWNVIKLEIPKICTYLNKIPK